MKDEIKMIPIERIRILNPRYRDRKKFEAVVQSIRVLGLKKPIQVSLRAAQEQEGAGYDLVCGQGRIEAFMALGYKEIPAVIIEASKEERLLRSLAENMARRHPKPGDLLQEIERLKAKNYRNAEIARKLGISDTMVGGFLKLKKAGEERVLEAALIGKIPISVAMDIVRTEGVDAQRQLFEAYEKKELNQDAIRTAKRLIAHRAFLGKQRNTSDLKQQPRSSAQKVVDAYRREGQRLKLMIRKARVCEGRLAFVITSFNNLLKDQNFTNLLQAESLMDMPKNLWEKLDAKHKGSA